MKSFLGSLMTVAAVGAGVLGAAQAQGVKVVNKNLGYLLRTDPITDVNTSYIVMFEVNDTGGDTGLRFRCDDDGNANPWGILSSKNEILPYAAGSQDAHLWPEVIVRLGTDAPFTVSDRDLYSITDDTRSVGIDGPSFDRMVAGLNAGKRLVIRLTGDHLRQPLTYTFSGQGFASAWQGVRACK